VQREKTYSNPSQADAIQRLRQLGFTESEAHVYVAMLPRQPLTGYELAKVTGVPRANVYAVLQKLEQRGAAVRLDGQSGTRYAPVPFAELLKKLKERYQQALAQADQALNQMAPAGEPPAITQFEGYNNLIETAQHMLGGARERLMLGIWPEEAKNLVEAVTCADQRQVDITSLCMAGCRDVCGYCRGTICRYPFGLEHTERWLLLIADGEELLAGSVPAVGSAVALRTRQPFLVQLAAGYMRQSMAVATLVTDLDLHLDKALGTQTRAALAKLVPPGAGEGWLEYMRAPLRQRAQPEAMS